MVVVVTAVALPPPNYVTFSPVLHPLSFCLEPLGFRINFQQSSVTYKEEEQQRVSAINFVSQLIALIGGAVTFWGIVVGRLDEVFFKLHKTPFQKYVVVDVVVAVVIVMDVFYHSQQKKCSCAHRAEEKTADMEMSSWNGKE